jgi:hypothetical protein
MLRCEDIPERLVSREIGIARSWIFRYWDWKLSTPDFQVESLPISLISMKTKRDWAQDHLFEVAV